MSTHEHELMYEAMLRNALRMSADSIEPGSDGLDKIRTRVRRRPYPLPIAWVEAAWACLTMRLPEGVHLAAQQWAPKIRPVSKLFLPTPAAADSQNGKSSPWSLLRPLAAFATAVFVVAFGTYVAINPAALSTSSGQSSHQTGGGGNSPNGGNGAAYGSQTPVPSTGPGHSATSSSPKPTSLPCLGKLGPSGHPSTSKTATPTPTPTPTTSTPSPSTSPTPTPSTSNPSPSASSPAAAGDGQPSSAAGAQSGQATTDALTQPSATAGPAATSSCAPSPSKTKSKSKNHHKGTVRPFERFLPASRAKDQPSNTV
ncbi:MAG: hypothetical protein ACLQFR_03590 [Streptosporangiaceae bacterium]